MDVIKWFCCFVLTITIVSQSKGSGFLFKDKPLCEQSNVEIMCPNDTVITEVNISTPTLENDVCANANENIGLFANKTTVIKQCIGNNSCRISGTEVDFTDILEYTWKLNVNYTCDKENLKSNIRQKTICPSNISRYVRCGSTHRKVNIASANLKIGKSVCSYAINDGCADYIEDRIEEVCNRNQNCNTLDTEEPDSYWNICIMIPKYVYISFLCKDVSSILAKNEISHSDKTVGIAVGVISGLLVLVLIGAIYVYVIRYKTYKTPNHIEDDTLDYDGNKHDQSVACHSNEHLCLSDKPHSQLRLQYLKTESKPMYANLPETKQHTEHGERITNFQQPDENVEYTMDSDIYDSNGDYDRIIRSEKRRDDKFKDGDHVYSHTVDDEYDTAQISKDIPRNQNYDRVVFMETSSIKEKLF